MHRKAAELYETLCGRFAVPVFGLLALLGAMAWAVSDDPFDRIEFELKVPGQARVKGIAVLPKPFRPRPVVIYVHGSGGSLLNDGIELRQLAELGIAAVGLEYDQTNATNFDAQFIALNQFVSRQSWAMTNAVAWVGTSLGAQRTLSFALRHPEIQPQLLVRISGGLVEDLNALFPTNGIPHSAPRTPHLVSCPVLIVHGDRDEVFPVQDAKRLADLLRTNGVPLDLKILPDRSHRLDPDRGVVMRLVAEYCRNVLTPAQPFQGVLQWRILPFVACMIPAFGWAGFCVYRRRWKAWQIQSPETQVPLRTWEKGLRWAAIVLSTLAVSETAFHLLTPRFAISDRTLSLARRYLIGPKMVADFDVLSANPGWLGKRLKNLLEHVELAHYNRNELINWKVEDQIYKDFVLSPIIDGGSSGELNWRRPLWENFYPRIRKQNTPGEAAQIVIRFLRERVTIAPHLDSSPPGIESIWKRQITDEKGFEQIYVAALRSVGVGARLDTFAHAEFWTGDKWTPAPRPIASSFLPIE